MANGTTGCRLEISSPNRNCSSYYCSTPNYADTILNITITGPLIRIDFGTVVPAITPEGKQEMRARPVQQLVMPLEGFVRSYEVQTKVIQKLMEDGALKVTPPAESPVVVTGSDTAQ